MQTVADYAEARNRFQCSANKVSTKLELAERACQAETVRADELANDNKMLTGENKEFKDKLYFEEDRLEAANRRINEANERADSIEQQLQEDIDVLEGELSEVKRDVERQQDVNVRIERGNEKLKIVEHRWGRRRFGLGLWAGAVGEACFAFIMLI